MLIGRGGKYKYILPDYSRRAFPWKKRAACVPDFELTFVTEVGMPKHSAAKRRARKEKCPGFLAEHVQPDPSQLSRQLGASSQAVLHLPTGAGASLGHSGARGHTTQCFNL